MRDHLTLRQLVHRSHVLLSVNMRQQGSDTSMSTRFMYAARRRSLRSRALTVIRLCEKWRRQSVRTRVGMDTLVLQ
jgi:hypothetical protein